MMGAVVILPDPKPGHHLIHRWMGEESIGVFVASRLIERLMHHPGKDNDQPLHANDVGNHAPPEDFPGKPNRQHSPPGDRGDYFQHHHDLLTALQAWISFLLEHFVFVEYQQEAAEQGIMHFVAAKYVVGIFVTLVGVLVVNLVRPLVGRKRKAQ